MENEINENPTVNDSTNNKKVEVKKKRKTNSFHKKVKKEEKTEKVEVKKKETKTKENKPKEKRATRGRKKEGFKFKTSPIKIIPLGGLLEIGKNITVFEYEDEIVIVDCGLAFPTADMLGVDFVIADTSYLEKNKHTIFNEILKIYI